MILLTKRVWLSRSEERLKEKLTDFKRACKRLDEATKIQVVNDIVYDGVIQRFEFTFELSWKAMKMFLEYTGITEIKSPRTAIREAYSYGLIDDGEQWIAMMIDRTKTPHLYDEGESKLLYEKVRSCYSILLSRLCERLQIEMKNML